MPTRQPPVHTVRSLHDFAQVILDRLESPFHTLRGSWTYRGQTDEAWPLVPQILRIDFTRWRAWHRALKPSHQEQALVRAFRKVAAGHLGHVTHSDWNWLALAQHHGLATRLLDWSYNPQVALYFAVRSSATEQDSCVWCYKHPDDGPSADSAPDPFTNRSIVFFEPTHVSPRISVQSGCFTSHPIDLRVQPWVGQREKIIIPSSARAQLRRELFRFGVHEQSLFPDLDGLAKQTNWRYSTLADEGALHPVRPTVRKRR